MKKTLPIATAQLLEGLALPVQDLEVQVITTDSSWDEFNDGSAPGKSKYW